MSSTPPILPSALQPPSDQVTHRSQSVVMGRGDFLSVVLRLIGSELYKLQRRPMLSVLTALYILAMLGVFLLFGLNALYTANAPLRDYLPPQCSQGSDQRLGTPCLNHPPAQSDLHEAQLRKQEDVASRADPLQLPNALNIATQVARNVGFILIIILAGTIVGGEYGVGTVRLMFTRGPTRTQFLLAKIGALLICIAVSYLGILLLGIGLGALFHLLAGAPASFTFLSFSWLGHAILYVLSGMLGLFVYAMLALFLAALGRSTAAGVAGGLAWSLLEGPISLGLRLIGALLGGTLGNLFLNLPGYFISTNADALVANQGRYLFSGQATPISDLQALLVLAAYLVIFIGLSWWITVRRDVTN